MTDGEPELGATIRFTTWELSVIQKVHHWPITKPHENYSGNLPRLKSENNKRQELTMDVDELWSKYLTLDEAREDLRLMADDMSTHAALAKKIGISPQYLHDILAGRREPGPKVLAFLKIKKVVLYEVLE